MSQSEKKLLETLKGRIYEHPPVWMMRQAGRHLPEYLELRSRAKDFLDFCYSPSLATEATLQPIRRYGMDGAILFADILLILDAMGRNVRFVAGEGPKVDPAERASDLDKFPIETLLDRMSPVYETVSRVKTQLPSETTLIGFAGAPWTVAVYAIEGKGGTDKSKARLKAYQEPDDLDAMLDILVETTAHYLKAQADAGADALMVFDSWAEGLSENSMERLVVKPTEKLIERVRELGVTQPIIGFPRGSGAMLGRYAEQTGVTGVGLDTALPVNYANEVVPKGMPVQGNLDPLLLIAGGNEMDSRIRQIKAAFKNRPHIFNLGHGVTPQTPIANVERAVRVIRGD
ncbi:uroporphyrinogen decarboxylase [Hirschia litorea]|uniref:Uroporphyrinogen decarboxylase n=1 Tax=Hirschia litorea TaxID=1199156 RepID=A0ABW2IMG8_9PROT